MKEFPFQFGAEVYTWFMNEQGKTHQNRLGHMIEISSKAGFTGIEPIHGWMGDLSEPEILKEKLHQCNIELVAIALALNWNELQETEQERMEADKAISLLQHFPGALLCTVQKPTGRHDIENRRRYLTNCVNTVSRRAMEKGVPCSFHPNSPHTSITRTKEDYEVLLESLDSIVTGWTPDVGHIRNGGMDPLELMKKYQSLINLVHYKDWNGEPEWSLMGKGKINLVAITKWLEEINYHGWIICEDEAPEALDNPDEVTIHDGKWIKEELLPSLK
jgi:inosose dehydratase